MPDISDDDYLRRVENERHRREDELLALLLLLIGRARRDATVAAQHGFSYTAAIQNVIVGSAAHRGAAPWIARAMAQAHRDGYRRVGLAAGTRSIARADAGALAALASHYRTPAQIAARAMADSLASETAQALLFVPTGLSVREAIAQAFTDAGYSTEKASALYLATERAIVTAHSAGVLAAAMSGAVPVTGLRHVSILDEATTDICEQRHGLQLPIDDPYWHTNAPQLHWRCRSTLVPLFGEFEPSDWRPTIPPMPGFGLMPVGFPFTVAA